MNCQQCQKESDGYHSGNLTSGTKREIEAHLQLCKRCAESYKLQILAFRVMDQEKQLVSNPFLLTRIMTQIGNAETPELNTASGFIRLLRPVFITVALAIAVFSGIKIGNIYRPVNRDMAIPVELALIDDAAIESVDVLSNQ